MHLSYWKPISCAFSSWVSSKYAVSGLLQSNDLIEGSLFTSWLPSGFTVGGGVMAVVVDGLNILFFFFFTGIAGNIFSVNLDSKKVKW